MPREWTEAESAIIRSVEPRRRTNHRLTIEQIVAIRKRIDSLSVPWTYKELAEEFGVAVGQVARIARRRQWQGAAYEPEGGEWWWEKKRQERLATAQERKGPTPRP